MVWREVDKFIKEYQANIDPQQQHTLLYPPAPANIDISPSKIDSTFQHPAIFTSTDTYTNVDNNNQHTFLHPAMFTSTDIPSTNINNSNNQHTFLHPAMFATNTSSGKVDSINKQHTFLQPAPTTITNEPSLLGPRQVHVSQLQPVSLSFFQQPYYEDQQVCSSF